MKHIYGERGQYLGQVNDGQTYSSTTGYALEEIKEIEEGIVDYIQLLEKIV